MDQMCMTSVERVVEVHRLAVLGRRGDIAATVGEPLAIYWRSSGAYRELRLLCERALQLGTDAARLDRLATATRYLGDPRGAIPHFEQALTLRRETSDRRGEANTLNNIGSIYQDLGQPDNALDHYQQALPIARETSDRRGEAATLNNIGSIYRHTWASPTTPSTTTNKHSPSNEKPATAEAKPPPEETSPLSTSPNTNGPMCSWLVSPVADVRRRQFPEDRPSSVPEAAGGGDVRREAAS